MLHLDSSEPVKVEQKELILGEKLYLGISTNYLLRYSIVDKFDIKVWKRYNILMTRRNKSNPHY